MLARSKEKTKKAKEVATNIDALYCITTCHLSFDNSKGDRPHGSAERAREVIMQGIHSMLAAYLKS